MRSAQKSARSARLQPKAARPQGKVGRHDTENIRPLIFGNGIKPFLTSNGLMFVTSSPFFALRAAAFGWNRTLRVLSCALAHFFCEKMLGRKARFFTCKAPPRAPLGTVTVPRPLQLFTKLICRTCALAHFFANSREKMLGRKARFLHARLRPAPRWGP